MSRVCPTCGDISDHGPGEVTCLRRAQVRSDDDLLARCLAAEALVAVREDELKMIYDLADEAGRQIGQDKTPTVGRIPLAAMQIKLAEATRRLAVVEEAVRQALDSYERRDPPGVRGYVAANLVHDLRAALEK